MPRRLIFGAFFCLSSGRFPFDPCDIGQFECVFCAVDPIGETVLEVLTLIAKVTVEGEVGGFVGGFVEVGLFCGQFLRLLCGEELLEQNF